MLLKYWMLKYIGCILLQVRCQTHCTAQTLHLCPSFPFLTLMTFPVPKALHTLVAICDIQWLVSIKYYINGMLCHGLWHAVSWLMACCVEDYDMLYQGLWHVVSWFMACFVNVYDMVYGMWVRSFLTLSKLESR